MEQEIKCHEEWFSYDPDDGFETHATAEAAKARAEEALAFARDEACDGWAEGVEQICWGRLVQHTALVSRKHRPPAEQLDEDECDASGVSWAHDFDTMDEYELLDAAAQQRTGGES